MSSSDKSSVWVNHLTLETAQRNFQDILSAILEAEGQSSVRSIAIKINICDYRRPESGAITDPRLLDALLYALRERYVGVAIHIIENDATSVEMWSAFKLFGFVDLARKYEATLTNVADGEWRTVGVPDGIVFQEIEIPTILDDCDLFINFAKLKTNGLTKMTGCLKNIFGLLRMKRKVVLHNRINQVLVDMNKVIRPGLCLVDGYIGMEGMGGPAFGRPKRCELVIAGTNPVAVDACGCRIMGFRPLSVEHVKLCHLAGLGPINYKLETDIPGFNYKQYKFHFEHWEYWLRNAIRSRAGIAA